MTPIPTSALLVTQSDERLLALARSGHERAFEAIVKRYRTPLRRYLRRLLPEEAAEDALQQASINAWTSLSGGARINDLRPWLYRVAHNAAIDVLRAGKYDLDELSDSLSALGSTEEDVERRAVIRETLASVAALPDGQREALLRTAIEGDPRADIARDLGVTEGAVRQLVHRARTTLRAAATAVTPMPVVAWIAAAGPPSVDTTARIAEVAAGVGTAGAGAVVIKSAAVVVAAAALTTGTVQIVEHDGSSRSARVASANAAEPPAHGDPVGAPAGSALQPVGIPVSVGNASGTSTSVVTGARPGRSESSSSSGKGGSSSGSGREDGADGHGTSTFAGDGSGRGRGEDDDGSRSGTSGSGGPGEHGSGSGKGTSGSGGSSEGSGKPGSGSSGDTKGDDDSPTSGGSSESSGSGSSGSSGSSSESEPSGSSGSGSSGSGEGGESSGSGKSGESSKSGKGGSGSGDDGLDDGVDD